MLDFIEKILAEIEKFLTYFLEKYPNLSKVIIALFNWLKDKIWDALIKLL